MMRIRSRRLRRTLGLVVHARVYAEGRGVVGQGFAFFRDRAEQAAVEEAERYFELHPGRRP